MTFALDNRLRLHAHTNRPAHRADAGTSVLGHYSMALFGPELASYWPDNATAGRRLAKILFAQ